jgi:hypothetical protein
MSLGAYPGETDIHRGTRRIVVGYFVFGALVRLPVSASEFVDGRPGVGVVDITAALTSVLLLGALALKPHRFVGIVDVALFLILVEVLTQTGLLGGLVPSDLVILFGVLAVVGALIVLPFTSAFLWFLAYLATLALAVMLPERIEPNYAGEGSPADIAFTIAGVLAWVFPSMAYFVRQRDRFQKESDDVSRQQCGPVSARVIPLPSTRPGILKRRTWTRSTSESDPGLSGWYRFACAWSGCSSARGFRRQTRFLSARSSSC